MKERAKGIITGLLIGTVITGSAALATTGMQSIDVFYDNIKIYMDGTLVEPKDANGQTVEPFIYNGTTYLPVRAISNAIGKDVDWDGIEKVVYLGVRPGNVQSWFDECKPYQYNRGTEYTLEENTYFTMSGNNYTNGYVLNPAASVNTKAEALYNLNGQYENLSFKVGHIDGTPDLDVTLNVYLDGEIAYTTLVKYDDVAKEINIPLENALQMKIEMVLDAQSNNTSYGFSDGKFE